MTAAPSEPTGRHAGSSRSGSKVREDARLFARYVRAVSGYLATTATLDDCRAAIECGVRDRARNLLVTLDGAVFTNPASPYRPLLEHAGVERGDVVRLLETEGVEGALSRLRDAGVYVRLDELKGLVPIRRGSFELPVGPADFDNPLAGGHYQARTGGSGGSARPILVDLGLVGRDACHFAVVLDAFGAWDRPTAIWYPMPPGVIGLKVALWNARLGRPVERWFSHTGLPPRAESVRPALLAASAWTLSRTRRRAIPFPSHTPTEDARRVAAWMDARAPALLACTPSSAVRACMAAEADGLDLDGALFRLGGEPYTAGKAASIRSAGARAAPHYALSEAGMVGAACARPEHVDEVHLALDKAAVVAAPAPGATDGRADLFLTNLLSVSPKVLLNAETGDSAVLGERDCGCSFEALGLVRHAHTIRSAQKLTSEGMNVVGETLLELVDTVLPARFGGRPTDYQLVELEVDGLTKVRVRVSPSVGPVDERELLATVLAAVGSGGRPEQLMATVWEEAGTLELVREEPRATAASKIVPLYRQNSGAQTSA